MTIVAGFVVQDGIVLCADTMYSGGMKVDRTKLFPARFDNGLSVVFALAGHEGCAKMAIQDCNDALAAIASDARSMKRIRRAVLGVVNSIHKNDIAALPQPTAQEEAQFSLLVAAWNEIEGLHLFKVLRTSIAEVKSYECHGIGRVLCSAAPRVRRSRYIHRLRGRLAEE
jgi:hypothetical protein